MSKFWIYDPSVILDNNKYWQIIPTKNMKLTEQLNTISRFLIYLIILLIFFKRDSVLLLLAIVAIIIIIIYHSLYVNDINSVKLDINENFVDEFNEYVPQKNIITSPIDMIVPGSTSPLNLLGSSINGQKGSNAIDLQTAYIDSNGDYVFGDLKKDSNINGGINGGGINGGGINGGINGGGINGGAINGVVNFLFQKHHLHF